MSTGLKFPHLIVTGADGYLGKALVERALLEGLAVTVLSRRTRPESAGVRRIHWRLGDDIPLEALDPDRPAHAHALVHFAHDWREIQDDNLNISGAARVKASARALGVGRRVFISSLSARQNALNAYGRIKWKIEQIFCDPEDVSLRVGLVYGGPRVAMYGLLCRLVSLTSVLPMIKPQQGVQPIHRSEVARGVLLAVESDMTSFIGLAGPKPIAFGAFLDGLARCLRGGRLHAIPTPLTPILWLCALSKALPMTPTLDRERVLGLAGSPQMDTKTGLERLGLTVEPFEKGMSREAATRRTFAAEGRALLRYVLRAEPGGALVRRYVRAAPSAGPCSPLPLGLLLCSAPWLLRFVEPFGSESPLALRLKLASALAEASPEGDRLLERRRRVLGLGLAILAGDAVLDLLALPARAAASAFNR